jgi:hypothetical protein
MGQEEQDIQYGIGKMEVRTEQEEQDSHNKTGRTE